MKRNTRRFLVFGVVFLGVLVLSANVSAKTVLKCSSQWTEYMTGSKIASWFADEIKKATKGEVEIKIYFSESLAKAGENLHLLKSGAIDMAEMSPAYFPAELPITTAANTIPFGFDNICEGSAIGRAFMDEIPAFMEESLRHNIRPLFFHLLNDYFLVTREPVKRLSDMKGKKIRAWGNQMPRLFAAAGGMGVSVFIAEVYETLQRGVADGTIINTDGCVAYKLYEVAKHITEYPTIWQGPAWGCYINEKVWQKLPPDHKKIFLETAERARKRELTVTYKADTEARKTLKAHGVQFHKMPEEDVAKWKEATPDFRAEWVNKMEKKGKGQAARDTIKLWDNIRRWVVCP
ncbi:MAG TPA: C4-dicarboxylate TRAP transporter substrate-binding protein [Desulfatiglandales bacterium]|nr:C4-dicarboxylate TRAP transporter substrate-binding protein [Desulfatiglandales bacterium]